MPSIGKIWNLLGILAAVAVAHPAQAALARMGPLNPDPRVGGYPQWYQDKSGLALEFCDLLNQSEVDGGWCLLLPPDIPALPESYPNALAGTSPGFSEEHFYYNATATIKNTNSPVRALLVIALEAANAPLTQQLVFTRIRYKLVGAPTGFVYRFIHPYGDEKQFLDPGPATGTVFVTDDVGINCNDFSCAMNGRVGPWLLPSPTPGGKELPPVTPQNPVPDANGNNFGGALSVTPYPFAPGDPNYGKAYLADPARVGPVTGSPLPKVADSTGALRDHNIFRIEAYLADGVTLAPACNAVAAGTQCVDLDGLGNNFLETTLFSVAGRVYGGTMPGQVKVDRATYTRSASGETLQVFASGTEPGSGRMPGQPTPQPSSPKLSFFNAPCTPTGDPAGTLGPPGATTAEVPLTAQGTAPTFWAMISATHAPQICVKDAAARDVTGALVPGYFQATVTDQVTITSATYNPAQLSLTVNAISSDTASPPALSLNGTYALSGSGSVTVPFVAAPPTSAQVTSSGGGVAELLVTTVMNAGPIPPSPQPPPSPKPVAVNDTLSVFNGNGGTVATLDVVANDANVASGPISITFTAPQIGTLATGVLGASGLPAIAYSAPAGATGVDTFTYTVTTADGVSNAGTVSVTLVSMFPIAVNDVFAVTADTTATLNLVANDVEPNPTPGTVINGISGLTPAVGGAAGGVGCAGAACPIVTDLGNGSVSFTGGTPGAYTFTYLAKDSASNLSASPATVTVNVIAADKVAVTSAKYVQAQARWVIVGTDGTPGDVINVTYQQPASTGRPAPPPVVVGAAVVDGLGNWTLDIRGVTGALVATSQSPRPNTVTATATAASNGAVLATSTPVTITYK
jgi:hypothetical protein